MVDEQNQYNVIPHYDELNASRSRLFFQKRKMLQQCLNLEFHDLYPVHYQARTNAYQSMMQHKKFSMIIIALDKKKNYRLYQTMCSEEMMQICLIGYQNCIHIGKSFVLHCIITGLCQHPARIMTAGPCARESKYKELMI